MLHNSNNEKKEQFHQNNVLAEPRAPKETIWRNKKNNGPFKQAAHKIGSQKRVAHKKVGSW